MESYEEWDVTIPSMPSRSHLYCLEPVGIGTSYVESLTSYVARLAEAHHVIPKFLVTQEILPLQGEVDKNSKNYYSRLNKFWQRDGSDLNGISLKAENWVDTLQKLTACNNLRFLTMLTWSQVISIMGLLRRSKAWCPECYNEWRINQQIIYEPLLWALSGVEICPQHKRPLHTSCPRCQKLPPLLTPIARPGYCSLCQYWLGNKLESKEIVLSVTDFERQFWVAEAVGELLANAPKLLVPQKSRIAVAIKMYAERYTNGNLSALARQINVNLHLIHIYANDNMPSFSSLLLICCRLSIKPMELLMMSPTTPVRNSLSALDHLSIISRGKGVRVTPDHIVCIRTAFELILAEKVDLPLTLQEIAHRIGCRAEILRRYCPELCKEAIKRWKQQWSQEDLNKKMRYALENALYSVEPLSLSAVARQLKCSLASLVKYFPDLSRDVVTKYRERFNDQQIKQCLQAALTNESEFPSVNELARRMRCENYVFWNRFPDLSKQVADRRVAEMSRQKEERASNINIEIRRAILEFHQLHIYPSSERVKQVLSDPHVLRRKEGHKVWLSVLKELGYSTDG